MDKCPHAERCYRRNPHHFMEYDHPHLNKFLEEGDNFTLPQNFPQSREVVTEQLNVLKLLNKGNKRNNTREANLENSKKIKLDETVVAVTEKSDLTKGASVPSTSRSDTRKPMNKKTVFVPGKGSASNFNHKTSMAAKMERNSPYNLFFTTIPKSYETLDQENAVTFADLLCPSLGDLKCSLQLNFMIDVSWLAEQYQVHNVQSKPLTVVYGYEFPGMEAYMKRFLPNVKYHRMKLNDPFGIHHSKIGVYVYNDDSIRIVVSTANLYYEDWNHYNQGLWVSPLCRKLPPGSTEHDGGGPTGFKTAFLRYLRSYGLPILQEWIDYVSNADFGDVKVFFVPSIPGKHYPKDPFGCHLYRMQDLLTRHCNVTAANGPNGWEVNAQASSIGSLGKEPSAWLRSVLLRSLSCRQKATPTTSSAVKINVIYPSVNNVLNSYFGPEGGGCLPYSKGQHEKQLWLKNYLFRWSADGLSRSRAMPHIKTYCRISPCKTKLAWFLLTSANISKAAWGGNIQRDSAIYVRSYEAGVLFLPSFFDEDKFSIGAENKKFPFMYDRELKPYESEDYPWCN